MRLKIGSFHVLLTEGTLNKNNTEAIVKKAIDFFSDKPGFLQCCSIELVPSLDFALNAMENALRGKEIGNAKPDKKAMAFLLWLYCTTQLNKAIELAGKSDRVVLAVAALKESDLDEALAIARESGFREQRGLMEENLKENLDKFVEEFNISEKEIESLSDLSKHRAVECLLIERQALLAL